MRKPAKAGLFNFVPGKQTNNEGRSVVLSEGLQDSLILAECSQSELQQEEYVSIPFLLSAGQIRAVVDGAKEIDFDMPPHYYLVNRFIRIGKIEILAVDFFIAVGITAEQLKPLFPNPKPLTGEVGEDDYHRLGAFIPDEHWFAGLAKLIGKPVRITVGVEDRRAVFHPDGTHSN